MSTISRVLDTTIDFLLKRANQCRCLPLFCSRYTVCDLLWQSLPAAITSGYTPQLSVQNSSTCHLERRSINFDNVALFLLREAFPIHNLFFLTLHSATFHRVRREWHHQAQVFHKVTAIAFSCAGRPRGVNLVNCKEQDLHLSLCFP